ncbi:MAG: aminotransferase class V-fold PLP-dependent enzyme, partial [Planctomyces sp.]
MGQAAMQPSIYLDNNATTQIAPEVLQAMTECWEAGFANPGSQHAFGRAARTRLEDARESIAAILESDPSEVIFTSGVTEAINLAVHGLTCGRRGSILLTRGEHPAVREACQFAAASGLLLRELPVDQQGRLMDSEAIQMLDRSSRLACLILAHNETGV